MKTIKWLDRNFEILLMVCALLVIVFVMGAQVVARKLLGASIEWSEELGRYLFVWMGFLSISYTLARGYHHPAGNTRYDLTGFGLKIPPRARTGLYAGYVRLSDLPVLFHCAKHESTMVQHRHFNELRVQRDSFLLCPDCTAAGAGLDPHAEKQTGRKKCKGVCSERGSGEIPNDGNGEGW